GSAVPRNAFSEWFWIEDGKIRNIWTAMYYPGAERPVPNWPPFDGNFPLPVFTTSAPAPATASNSYAADLAAISAFNVRYLKAINDGDIDALSALTDDDHIAISPNGPPLMGKAANVATNGRIYQQSRIIENWTPEETVIEGNLAYQRGSFSASGIPKAGGPTRTISGSFLRIYRRQPDGSWVMTRDMFNAAGLPNAR
ncbi:MAG TPA: DUF4440 domain-containing protein, partial [Steroidobacteraceae bacterium]|nr:DUF4440 domain-containing protein [Steroidobacteraceae bacterium]